MVDIANRMIWKGLCYRKRGEPGPLAYYWTGDGWSEDRTAAKRFDSLADAIAEKNVVGRRVAPDQPGYEIKASLIVLYGSDVVVRDPSGDLQP